MTSLWVELLVGAALVCSEAHTAHPEERIAVAASVRVRVLAGADPVQAMRRPGDYAPHLCPPSLVRPEHAAAYLVGRLGLGPAWTRGVEVFYHERLDSPERRERWRRRGFVPVRAPKGARHVWWRRRTR
jgi:hypothetical protein